MRKIDATQTRYLLNLEIDTLNAVENRLREQIRILMQRGCKLQRERMDKVEQLAKLKLILA
jgi:predicted  nucleic acid-binding Zn-ribbon protein